MNIEGAIFDMDGLMVDSEPIWHKSWEISLARVGLSVKDGMLEAFTGSARPRVEKLLREFYGDSPEAFAALEDHYVVAEELFVSGGAPKKPGLDDLLVWLSEKGVPTAVASSSSRVLVEAVLGHAGITGYFDVVRCGDGGYPSKPAPDIFLSAAEGIGVSPSDAMVLEDSPAGIRAAVTGGFIPVMVPDVVQPDDELRSLAYRVCSSLGEVKELLAAGTF